MAIIESKNKREFILPIAEMYKGLTPQEQAEAEYYLIRYFEIINAIFEEKYNLTSSDIGATV